MLQGEHWLRTKRTLKLTIIPVANYRHSDLYQLPVAPTESSEYDGGVSVSFALFL